MDKNLTKHRHRKENEKIFNSEDFLFLVSELWPLPDGQKTWKIPTLKV